MDKTFDAAAREPEIYAAWEASDAFKAGKGAHPGPDGAPPETFSIMIPPPNVTGALHMGHAFNNTLQDILTRWHRMRGFDTLWQPGTDHAGIATQMVVERELAREGNETRREMGREKFVERVWQQKQKSRGNIRAQLERLGASCDWSREAFTMSGAPKAPPSEEGNFHDAVLRVFVDLYHKGLIYRGKRLVNWDPHFETAISDLEVEQVEQDGRMWHFRYPLADGATYEYVERDEDGNELFRETRDYISIATTRPETMLGDGAVAVHPSDTRYAPIVGQLCEIPVGPKEHRRLIPIITDPYPDPAFGSGAVKITGAHDFNDYAVAQRGGVPLYRLMDTRAHMRDDGEPYAEAAEVALAVARGERTLTEADADALNLVPDDLRGLDRYDARDRVVAQITAERLAVMVPETDPRLGTAAKKPAEQRAPAPEPGFRPSGATISGEAPDQVRGAEGKSADTPPLAPEEGGETRALLPLVEHRRMVQPTGDRSKAVIEPMLTDQWFVDAEKIVGPAIDAVRDGRTRILPESDAKVYFHWLENIEPWCISRQLWWGHQIPVWYGLDLSIDRFVDDEGDGALDEVELGRLLNEGGMLHEGEVRHCAANFKTVTEAFRDRTAALPAPLNHAAIVEVADKQAAIDRLAERLANYNIDQDPTHLVYPVWRDPDVLDTWFSSGLWPIGTLGWPEDTPELQKYFPTSVLVTGFDIIFFWVARMMMMQLEVVGQVPFETVYVHALVRDEKGKKMSKSLGNVLDPIDLIDEFGADAVRFTLTAMAAMGRDLKLSRERIAGYRNFTTKLWNAHRFAEMNGVPAAGAPSATPPQATATANRWIIGETARVREDVDTALAAFRFNDAANALYAFVWGKVCDWYVEFAKPLFDGETAEETREVMAWVLDQCLILLHPIMPFVTEELWNTGRDRATMLALAEWPSYGAELVDPASESEMRWVISLIENVRSVRGEMNVPAGAKVPLLLVDLDESGRNALSRNEELVVRLARLGSISPSETVPKGSATIAVEGGTFALPLADIIDIDAEKARLSKSLEKLVKEARGLEARFSNPRFVESAPPEVVDETRDLVAQKEEEEARLRAALARLSEAEVDA